MIDIGFIGAGTVGTALAVGLSGKEYPVVAVSSRTKASAQRLAKAVPGCRVQDSAHAVADKAQLVFITTPDDAIAQVATEIQWHPGQGVVHCSGADSTDILEPARKRGALVGGFHPLQTFASVAHAIENIPGSTFAIEADEPLLTTLQQMATAFEGAHIRLAAGDKVLYHAAAVVACNYLVTLVKLATDLWQSFGVSQQQATRALLPLLRGTLNNIDNVGIPHCLTGPIARGDSGTIKKHILALERAAPGILSTYRELGLQTIPIALAKGKIDEEKGKELANAIEHMCQYKATTTGINQLRKTTKKEMS
ncbi:MAG: DUF2520 domain-containing protein [Dehalococcoidia bacterium]|nr:DUF2520 domain-containing protein [Dehalococcoidia bacterium]